MRKFRAVVVTMIITAVSVFSFDAEAEFAVSQDQQSLVLTFDAHHLEQPLGCIYIQGEFFIRLDPQAIQKGEFRKEFSRFEKIYRDLGNPENIVIDLFIDGYVSKRSQFFRYTGHFSIKHDSDRYTFTYLKPAGCDQSLEQFVTTRIKRLRELRKRIQERGQQYSVDLTWVFMLSDEEKEKMFQPLPVPQFKEEDMPEIVINSAGNRPAELDWCNKDGKNWVTPVKHQKDCGSCWAFASVAQLEALYSIEENEPDLDLILSEQTVVTQCSDAGDCTNGDSYKALTYVKEKGIPTDSCDPYTAKDGPCDQCSGWKSEARTIHDVVRVTKFGEYKDYDKIISVLQNHPVLSYVATIVEGFDAYTGGIFSYEGEEAFLSDHVVCLVGWSDTEDYWKLKNSWGEDWGEDGFMRCRRGQGHRLGELVMDAVHKPLFVDAGPEQVVLENGKVQLNGIIRDGSPNLAKNPPDNYIYYWTPAEGLSNAKIVNPVASPAVSTMYYFTVKDLNVTRTDSILVLTDSTSNKALPLNINRPPLTASSGIYDQVSYTFMYSFSRQTPVKLHVINVSGRLVTEKDYGMKIGYGTLCFSLKKLPHGIYFFKIFGGSDIAVAKIIFAD